MKNQRQRIILELIQQYEISTQEALIDKLKEKGVNATQTTVSRDIRELKLVKGPTGIGTYKYVAQGASVRPSAPAHNSALTDAVIKVEAAENIVVIKTHSGMANAIAVCIDSFSLPQIVGTVAGDDTILLVIKSSGFALEIENELKKIFEV